MICINMVQSYCCDDISLIENYDKAINDKTHTWHCHHRLETDKNLNREKLIELNKYYNVPASELIFLTSSEHCSLHNNNRFNGMLNKIQALESRKKISEKMKGNKNPCYGRTGNKHPLYGIHRKRVYENDEHTKYHYEIQKGN